jgi:hypothetical protein
VVGVYSGEVLAGLDWLLVEAGRRGLRLLLTLTNYWKEFGGMQQYLRWGGGGLGGGGWEGGRGRGRPAREAGCI